MPASRLVVQLLTPAEDGRLAARARVVASGRLAPLLADGSRVLVGVALATRTRPSSFGEALSYLVVGSQAAANPTLVAQARALRSTLQASVARAGLGQLVGVLNDFLKRSGNSSAARDRLTLMFYQWVLDASPAYYLAGVDLLHEAFVADLACTAARVVALPFSEVLTLLAGEQPPGSPFADAGALRLRFDAMFATAFVRGVHRAADVDLKEADLPGLREGKDIVLAWFLIMAGLLSGATEIAALALAIDVAVGYLQFLHEIQLAELDDTVTEEEASSVSFAFGFTFLPVLPFALEALPKGKIASLVRTGFGGLQVAALVAALGAFCLSLAGRLRQLLEYHERLKLAREAGFSEYSELDLDTTIVVPLAALVRSE